MSGGGDPVRSRTAMEAATKFLVDDELKIIKLFTPPFHDTPKEPGYIKSYPPGVRENGGQYTHAATWFVIALAEMGKADEAYRCFSMLNPVNHALDEKAAEQLPHRTLCRGGRHLFVAGQGRARRLDLVHRLGRLAVPRGGREHPRHQQGGQPAVGQASPAQPLGWVSRRRCDFPTRSTGSKCGAKKALSRQSRSTASARPGSEIELGQAGEVEISVFIPR